MDSICTSVYSSLIATFFGEEKVSCDTRNSISNIIYRIRLINWTNLKKKSNSIREIYRETVLNIYIYRIVQLSGYASRLTLICTVGFNLVISRS